MTARATVKIARKAGNSADTPVYVRSGVWAVTAAIDLDGRPMRGRYNVTHVPSGLKVLLGWTGIERAKQLMRRLARVRRHYAARARFGQQPRRTALRERLGAVVKAWEART